MIDAGSIRTDHASVAEAVCHLLRHGFLTTQYGEPRTMVRYDGTRALVHHVGFLQVRVELENLQE